MKKKIILLTGNEQRHLYSASYLSSQKNIDLKLVIHESNIKLKENSFYEKDSDIKKHINLRKTEGIILFQLKIKKLMMKKLLI